MSRECRRLARDSDAEDPASSPGGVLLLRSDLSALGFTAVGSVGFVRECDREHLLSDPATATSHGRGTAHQAKNRRWADSPDRASALPIANDRNVVAAMSEKGRNGPLDLQVVTNAENCDEAICYVPAIAVRLRVR